MSFLGDLKTIGRVALGIAGSPIVGSIVTAANPAVGAIWNRTVLAITTIEAAHAQAGKDKTGTEKLAYVMTDFSQGLAVAQEVLRAQGMELVYDGRALEDAINSQVAAFNAAKKLRDSVKIRNIQQ
jgi:hypothetical protein